MRSTQLRSKVKVAGSVWSRAASPARCSAIRSGVANGQRDRDDRRRRGGAFAGNEIEKNMKKAVRYQVRVRMK